MSDGWQDILLRAQQLRHDLHSMPELGWQEVKTAERVRAELSRLGIPWRACADTGTVAWLNQSATGRHTALRGDMDALPIREQTGKPYASKNPGCMHACGHDGHTATLLACAEWLKRHEQALPGRVTLLFQPAEEGGHGARKMIEDGALEDVNEIYGWHNWPAIPFGRIACPDGIVMCGNGTFEITVAGQGGHASQPELCRDPILAASAIVLALQQIVSRRIAPQQTAVVSVTSIDARSAPTVIPDCAVIGGSIRVPDEPTRREVSQLLEEISQQTARAYGLECSVAISPRYQATINHAGPAARVRELWQLDHGPEALDAQVRLPLMASEDFSYYLQTIPGAFAIVGANDGAEHSAPCHNSRYDFNDRLIAQVTRLFARLVGAPLPELQA